MKKCRTSVFTQSGTSVVGEWNTMSEDDYKTYMEIVSKVGQLSYFTLRIGNTVHSFHPAHIERIAIETAEK